MQKSDVRRITPEQARRDLESGAAVLVCGYEADEKFQAMHLEGAQSLSQFRDRLPDIPKEQEIIFYCA